MSNSFNEQLQLLATIKQRQAGLEAEEKELLKSMQPGFLALTGNQPGVLTFERLGLAIELAGSEKATFDQSLIEAVLGPDLFKACLVFNKARYEGVLLKNPQFVEKLATAVIQPTYNPARLKAEAYIPALAGRRAAPKAPPAPSPGPAIPAPAAPAANPQLGLLEDAA